MTSVAFMVVSLVFPGAGLLLPLVFVGERLTLVVPSTRTCLPFVMAFTEIGLVPFLYIVEVASWTVTFTPADVVIMKLVLDTLSTVPVAPPEAGPDRAFDAMPPEPRGAPPMDDELDDDDNDDDLGEGFTRAPQPVLAVKESPKMTESHF
jgi:hypothetical protein